MNKNLNFMKSKRLQTVRHDDETGEWVFNFGDGYVLQVASPWRFMRSGAIVLGHCDHKQQFGLPHPINAEVDAYEFVEDRVIIEAKVADGSADLTINFGEGLQLEIFNNSSGYEGWTLNTPGNRIIVAQGGGNLYGLNDMDV